MTSKTLYIFDSNCYNANMTKQLADIDDVGEKIIRSRVRKFNNIKFLDEDDLIQEARIAYLKAREKYNASKKECTLEAYASVVIKYHLIKIYNKHENQMYGNSKASDGIKDIFDVEEVKRETSLDEDTKQAIDEIIKGHTNPMEQTVFDMYLNGLEYEEISQELEISVKTITYTIQRVRNILKENFPK